MAFEFLGMSGTLLYAFIVAAILLANWKLSKKDFLKFIPVSRQGLGIIGVLIMIVVGSSTAWWGYGETQAVSTMTGDQTITPGATFEAEGSESLENTTYDAATRTFTTHYYENVGAERAEYHATLDATRTPDAIIPVVVTITVYRTDSLTLVENAVCKVWAEVPTFYGINENAGIAYAAIDKDVSTQKYEVALAPTGITARDEYNYFSVAAGGSRAITVTADPYHIGLIQLDNYDSTDVKIHISGVSGYFTLRFVKIGETT